MCIKRILKYLCLFSLSIAKEDYQLFNYSNLSAMVSFPIGDFDIGKGISSNIRVLEVNNLNLFMGCSSIKHTINGTTRLSDIGTLINNNQSGSMLINSRLELSLKNRFEEMVDFNKKIIFGIGAKAEYLTSFNKRVDKTNERSISGTVLSGSINFRIENPDSIFKNLYFDLDCGYFVDGVKISEGLDLNSKRVLFIKRPLINIDIIWNIMMVRYFGLFLGIRGKDLASSFYKTEEKIVLISEKSICIGIFGGLA